MDKKKTFLASAFALVLGSSCCWMSSLLVWIGGGAFLTSVSSFIGGSKVSVIVFGVLIVMGLLVWYRRLVK